MRKVEFNVHPEIIAEFAQELTNRDLNNSVIGVTEDDEIIIELPTGYSLESPDVPAPISDPQGTFSHKVAMTISNDGKFLVYKRNFYFGTGGFIMFPTSSYSGVKNVFEAFNKANLHQLTLRQGTANPEPKKTN